MSETTASIAEWSRETFGPATAMRSATRANDEMAELLTKVSQCEQGINPYSELQIRDEIADVVICLAVLANRVGGDIWKDVEAKMAVNRQRKWRSNGDGTGQHIKEDPHGR